MAEEYFGCCTRTLTTREVVTERQSDNRKRKRFPRSTSPDRTPRRGPPRGSGSTLDDRQCGSPFRQALDPVVPIPRLHIEQRAATKTRAINTFRRCHGRPPLCIRCHGLSIGYSGSFPTPGGISRRSLERSVAFHGDDAVRDHEMRGQGAVDIEDVRGRSLPTFFRPAIDRAGDGANDAAEGQKTARDPYLQSASAEPARAGPKRVFFAAGLPRLARQMPHF